MLNSKSDEFPKITNLDKEEIKDLIRIGNILSISGLIKITMKAEGCISSDDLTKLLEFAQPELGSMFIKIKVQEFVDLCRNGRSFLKYDDKNRFCFPNSLTFK